MTVEAAIAETISDLLSARRDVVANRHGLLTFELCAGALTVALGPERYEVLIHVKRRRVG